MPSLGPLEILVVAVVALLVFGPEKLPEIARTVGRAASQMRRMASEFRDEFETSMDLRDEDDEDSAPARRTSGPGAPREDASQSRPGGAPGTGAPSEERKPGATPDSKET